MRSIKKIILMLLISLLVPISSFSQITYPKLTSDSLVVITPAQLKATNLIFLEHSKLLEENSLLNLQVQNLKDINSILSSSDSAKSLQINRYIDQIKYDQESLVQLNNSIINEQKKNSRLKKWTIGGISVSIALLIVLCVK